MSSITDAYSEYNKAYGSGFAWRVAGETRLDTYFTSKVSHVMYDSKEKLYSKEPLIRLHDLFWDACPSVAREYAGPLFSCAHILLDNKEKVAAAAAIGGMAIAILFKLC